MEGIERDPRWWLGLAHLLGYTITSCVWFAVVVQALVLLVVGNPDLFGKVSLTELSIETTPELSDVIYVLSAVWFSGWVALAVIGSALLPGPAKVFARVRTHLGLRSVSGGALAIGAFIGVAERLFPTWLIPGWRAHSVVMSSFAWPPLEGSSPSDAALVGAFVVAIALGKEIVFHGYLWTAIERSARPWLAWLLTSVVFASSLLDPSRALFALPIGVLLGWMRLRTGSIWPGVVLLLANSAYPWAAWEARATIAPIRGSLWLSIAALVLAVISCAAVPREDRSSRWPDGE